MVSLSGIIEAELLIGFFCVSVSVHVLNWRNTNEIQILFEVGSLFLTFCRLLMHVHVFPWILKQSKYHFGREFWYNFPPKKGKLSLWNFFSMLQSFFVSHFYKGCGYCQRTNNFQNLAETMNVDAGSAGSQNILSPERSLHGNFF